MLSSNSPLASGYRQHQQAYPTFCRPQFNERLTFAEFCRRAADELTQVASGFAYGLGEEK